MASAQNTNNKQKKPILKRPNHFVQNLTRPIGKTFRHQFDQILADNKKHKKNMQKLIFKTILFFVLLLILLIGLGAVGIYRYHSESKFIQNLSRIVPYPIAKIGDSKNPLQGLISYRDFLLELNSNLSINEQLKKSAVDSSKILSDDKLRNLSLNTVIDREIIIQKSKIFNLSVSDAEIESELKEAIDQAGGEENFANSIDVLYKKDLNQIKKEIRIGLLKLRMEDKIVLDAELNKSQISLIDGIYQRLNRGETFDDLARTYSQDPESASKGGDIGVITKSQIKDDASQSAFAEALFATPVGQYSKIISTPKYGYHIVKVNEKINEDQVKAQQILIKHISFESWYEETKNNFAKKYYINY